MAKNFIIKKRLELGFLGEGWSECYADFRPLTFGDLSELEGLRAGADDAAESNAKLIAILKDRFIGGKALTGDGIVDLEAGDVDSMPVEFVLNATKLLSGVTDPK